MIRQRSFVTNNNKENNAVISNIENESVEEQEFMQYSYGKIQSTTSTANTNQSLPLKNLTSLNNNNNNKKTLLTQNSMPIDENYRYESNNSQQSQDVANVNSGSNHSSNGSNGNAQITTSSLTAQMLLNDVRALAAQNQKTEQNLRELQRKINLQKGKRYTQIHHQDDKENAQLGGERKLSRNHSSSNQSYQSYNENYSSNNNNQSLNNNNNYKQQNTILTQISSNYQNIPSKQSTTHTNNNDLSLNDRILNQKNKMPAITQKDQYKGQTQYGQQQQQQNQLKKNNTIKPKLLEKNLSDQQIDKKYHQLQQLQQQQPQNNQREQQSESEEQGLQDNSKILREETFSSRLARVIINQNYSHDILNYIRQNEAKFVPRNCLQNHNISYQLRAKMVDWMIEVMKSYKCSEETYFMAVRLLDTYLEKSKTRKEPNDLHLIGVTCIFIACKYEEIYPLRLKIVEERIAHKKLSEEQIKMTEADILNTLNFNLLGTSPYEIAMQTLTLIGLQDKLSHQEFQYCHRICLYLSKMVLYDYEYFKASSYSLLAASVIYIVFKIISQMMQDFTAEQNIKPVIHILKIESKQLIDSSTRILNLAKNFDSMYPELKNLKKFNGFEIKGESDQSEKQE